LSLPEPLIPNYHAKKQQYLDVIRNTKTGSADSMHKYTSANPLSPEDISIVKSTLKGPLTDTIRYT
jgi:hypothetical protein